MNSQAGKTQKLTYESTKSRSGMAIAAAFGAVTLLGCLAGVGYGTQGLGLWVWGPVVIIIGLYVLFLINLFMIKSPRLQLCLMQILAGVVAPVSAIWLGLTIMICFDFAPSIIIGVCVLSIAPMFLFCWLEARHCVMADLLTTLKREKHLRPLPNGKLGYDPHWNWDLGTAALVPGFAWRKWVDRAVIVIMLVLIPFGSVDAFTSASLIPASGIVVGCTAICFALSWLLRQILTGGLAQLRFLRLYQAGKI